MYCADSAEYTNVILIEQFLNVNLASVKLFL